MILTRAVSGDENDTHTYKKATTDSCSSELECEENGYTKLIAVLNLMATQKKVGNLKHIESIIFEWCDRMVNMVQYKMGFECRYCQFIPISL